MVTLFRKWYRLIVAARMCLLWFKQMTQKEQRWSVEMIVDKTSWLCCIFCTFGFYIYDRMLFCFFYTDVLSQALSEDAAWDFLIIFKDDFYSIFNILIFYNNFRFHKGGLGSWMKMLPNQDLFFQEFIICKVIFHIKTHIFEYLCFCKGFSNPV